MQKRFLMRAAILLMAALLLSTTVTTTVLAASNISEMFILGGKPRFSAMSAQVVENTLYLLLEDKLVSVVPDQEEPTIIMNASAYPQVNWYDALLCSDGITLYLLDTYTGAMYQVEGNELTQVVMIDRSVLGQELEDGVGNVWFRNPFVQHGFVYVLYTNPETNMTEVYRFSLESGEGTRIATDQYYLWQIAPYKDGQILGVAQDSSTWDIIALDASSGKLMTEIAKPSGGSVGAVAYDSKNDKIYYLSDIELMLLENQKPITVDYLATNSGTSALYTGIWEGQYVFLESSGLYTCNTDPRGSISKIKPLTLCYSGRSFLSTDLLPKFTKLYPQTPIVVRSIESARDVLEKIVLDNLTRDASIDIFMIRNGLMDRDTFYKRGLADPLTSTALVDDVASMYPQIQDYLTQDGVLYGYPEDLYPQYWAVRPELLEEAQLGPIPETIDDYLDMMLLWYENFFSSRPEYTFSDSQTVEDEWRSTVRFLISQYIYAYASTDKSVSFNTPPFRSALEKLSTLSQWKSYDNNSVNSEAAVTRQSIFRETIVSPFLQRINPEHLGEEFILPPAFAEASQQMFDAHISYFIVNPYSQNKEAAIKFIEFMGQNMDAALIYSTHPDFNDFIERETYDRESAQGYKDEIADFESRIQVLEEERTQADSIPDDPQYAQALENERQADIRSLKGMIENRENEFAKLELERWECSAEVIAEYRKVAPYFNLDTQHLISSIALEIGAWEILSQYLHGNATLDQVLEELDHKVAMAFLEGQ